MNGLLVILNHIGLVLDQANARIAELERELATERVKVQAFSADAEKRAARRAARQKPKEN